MSTFLQMQTAIANYLLRDDLTNEIQVAINRAIAKYSKSRFWFDETEADYVTTKGQWFDEVPTIPNDIRQIDYVRITVNNVYYRLIQRTQQWIIQSNINNNQGQMTDWSWWEGRIYYYPVPQNAYTIRLYYQKKYPPLVDPTDSNDFTTIPEAEELIEAEALRWLYKRVILDADKAAEYEAEAKKCYDTLTQITESITGGEGNIVPTLW